MSGLWLLKAWLRFRMAELQVLLVHASVQLRLCEHNEFACILVTDVRAVTILVFSVVIGVPICINKLIIAREDSIS